MGKGIALQFKRAFPEMFRAYAVACEAGDVKVGRMHVWPTNALTGPRFIINFPTKQHWRSPSEIQWIDDGLTDLVRTIGELGIKSIAVPPLGAGQGGLDWQAVRPRIEAALSDVPDVSVLLYEPLGAPPAAEMALPEVRPALTLGRAALIETLGGYLQTGLQASLVEVQKLMYFLQVAGEPLSLRYEPRHYGPYADNLRHVLQVLEGSYLIGYGDGTAPVLDAEPIRPLPGAIDAASEALSEATDTRQRIGRVLGLCSGFESMYGMELLSTVHWVATHVDTPTLPDVIDAVHQWSPRKRSLFSPEHIEIAHKWLVHQAWVSAA
jgi:O-acetyl-ADP-ribose deacetylase (regulator of RNase III)